MSADSVVGIVWDVLKRYVVVPVERGFGYVIFSKRFANRLRGEVQNLENEDQRVKVLAEEARRNVRKLLDVFTTWEVGADKALEEAQELLDDFEKATKTCCYGTLPDPKSRYQLSRKAEGKIEAIKQLTQKCSRFNGLNDISFIDPASTSIKLPNDGVFESRALMIRKIMDALADNSNSVVGVYGMGGIGKSTLLVDVERNIREEKSFHSVAKADVTENPDIKTIQGEIADALGLTEIKNKETISGRAKLLHGRLQDEERQKKKVLIILDNLWEALELNKVGIPCGHDNRVIGCKLLLTSRDRSVLRSEMSCDKDFPLCELEEDEARSLFERLVGDKVHDGEFKPLVDEALHKCFGMPFLIVHMAKVFKHADLFEWKNVLKQIKLSKYKRIGEVINERLQLSYTNLKDAEKSLLALCVVCGTSKPSFENLVRYGVGCGLFREDDNMEEARESLKSGIHSLQASSLLLDDGDPYGFKIHDLVHEFVALVASRDYPLLVLKDKDKSITEMSKDKLKSCRAVCFPYIDMKELPQELDCPELQIFLLFTNDESLEVPYSLFRSMRKLMVLNLTRIRLTYSPSSSLQFLESLHTLCLDNCSLDNIAILGELKGLQILSFVNSDIYRLPREIGQLVELRLLDLNHCPQLEIIEPGVLQRLINLEELYMQNSFAQWHVMDQTPPANATLIELNHKKNLCTLHVSIPDPRMLPEDLNLEKLTKYEIQIGDVWYRWSECKGSRTLELKLDPLGNVLRKGCIQSILGKTNTLLLEGLDRNEQSVCAISQKGFPELKHLQVKNSSSIHYILQLPSHTHFMMLESLLLKNLINLEMICNSHISSKSFSILKVVQVESCDKMEVLFPLSVVRGLPQLEEIKVVGCKQMRGIVDADDGSKVELHNLRVLELCDLPDIKRFFAVGTAPLSSTLHDQVGTQIAFFNQQQVAFSSLKTLVINGLDNIEFLFFPSVIKSLAQLRDLNICNCKKMEAIIMEEEGSGLETPETLKFPMLTELKLLNLESLMCFSHGKCSREGSQDHFKSCSTALFSEEVAFQRLETLKIIGLDNFEFIFSPSMVNSLTQLENLTVSNCKKIETIIMEEERSGMEISEILVFLRLTYLELTRLKGLTCFSHGKCAQESRNHDCVRSCATALFNQEVAFPSLDTLSIEGMDNIEMIWDNQAAANFFPNLKFLFVYECNNLVNVVPSFILRRLLSLERLEAIGCDSLEVVFELQPPNPLDGHPLDGHVAFSLRELMVSRLPKLKCVWDEEIHHQVQFRHLHSISVSECKSLISLFSASVVARDLIQLENLENNKRDIVELIEKEELVVCESYLEEPTSNVEAIKGPIQELKVILPFPRYIRHLKTLNVSHCDGLSSMFTPTVAGNLVALTKLAISNCRMLTEVIIDEEIEEGHVVAFNHLKCIELDGLIRLRCFNSSGYTLKFPLLEDVIVTGCPNMKIFSEGPIEASKLERVKVSTKAWFFNRNLNITIQNVFEEMGAFVGSKFMRLFDFPELIERWHSELIPNESSWQLESLIVDKCPLFSNVIPSRLMLVLDNMSKLQVHDCESLEEIFDLEGLEDMESIEVLPSFRTLNLVNLPKLRRLWNKNLKGSKPCKFLTSMALYKCNNLRHAFIPSMASGLANLKRMEIKECAQMEGVIVEEESQGSAVENITLPNLEEIELECSPNLISFLLGKDHMLECPQLMWLTIAHCPKIRSLAGQSLKEMDHGAPSLFTPQVQFPQLNSMDLSHMDNLSKIWTDGLEETLTFHRLKEVKVRNCKSLENLFPYWLATSLTQLEKLQVESCEIEEIVTSRDDTPRSNTTQDLFPKLTSLVLHDMPQLKSFCPNLPTLNWPLLRELRVTHCDKLNMLSFAVSMNSWAQRDEQQDLSDQEAHSSFERDFPYFERLLLVNNNIQMIQDGNFPDGIFSKPKTLTLACFHDEKAIFPSTFLLERFQNLQSLEVLCSSFEDIFPDEGLIEEWKHSVLENLRELKLSKLHNLKRVWREDSLVSKILQSIKTFEVWDCPCLTTIFPTATSFQNLTMLVVKNSSGLAHLVTVSAIANLVHLESMTIIGCERMKELVANDGNGEGKVISFKRLVELKLQNLPSLQCFSSIPSCNFSFSFLMEIEVKECPKMKTFSKGMLSTPKLYYVSLFGYKLGGNWREEGDDLNTTIQKLSA